ncbi:hypothetical protein DF182_30115 [Chitinophaga flava]|uniref:Uncharacterized protein n=1 Tax=Chitinophaga flava TaxID=2259036 RepID=A0A365XWI4_9BACT|nr:hypothetical protein DF182_30115 [Chitinophaga flava]
MIIDSNNPNHKFIILNFPGYIRPFFCGKTDGGHYFNLPGSENSGLTSVLQHGCIQHYVAGYVYSMR